MSNSEDLSGLKVLVAEDNSFNQFIFKKILAKWNIVPSLAANGIEALELLGAAHFDIVFMDLQMPLMNGVEATQLIRKINPSIPIVAISAAIIDEEVERAKAAGIQEFVLKPFEPQLIHRLLTSLISN